MHRNQIAFYIVVNYFFQHGKIPLINLNIHYSRCSQQASLDEQMRSTWKNTVWLSMSTTSKITKPFFFLKCLLPCEVSREIYFITECCELVTCMGFKPSSHGSVAGSLEKTNHELNWCQDPQDCWNHLMLYRPNAVPDMFKNM